MGSRQTPIKSFPNGEIVASNALSPVARFGKSTEFGNVLDFVQNMVSDEVLRTTFNIPHLVVVGRQNMAKTTLINRLIGRYLLPMRKSETATHLQALTTYPIILNLRNGAKRSVTIDVHGQPGSGGTVEDPDDETVDRFLRDIAMSLPKVTGTPISKTPVKVTLQGPDLTTLTLVDLPGVHFANDDQRMNQATQNLVLDYIEKNNKSIVVIVSEVGDPTGDGAINLVMRRAPDYKKRAICVLTKPDKLRETDDMGKKVARNQSHFTLEDNRFILLRGKDGTDPAEKDWDCDTTRMKEMEWFRSHLMYKDMLHVCGIDKLMETMISVLADKMVQEIPVLVKEMRDKKIEVERELKELSETMVPETLEGKGALVMKLKQNLINKLKELLFSNTTDKDGGEQVRKLFQQFQSELLKVDPILGRKDAQIKKLQERLIGVEATLGDSTENDKLLQILLYEEFNPSGSQGSAPDASTDRLTSPVDQLIPFCEKLIDEVEEKLKAVVHRAIEECLDSFPTLKRAVETEVVWKIFDKKKVQTVNFIREFIAMQKKSIDTVAVNVPVPREMDEMITTYTTFPTANYAQPVVRRRTPGVMSQVQHLSRRLHPESLLKSMAACDLEGLSYTEVEDIKKIKRNVVRCFNVIKLNVADAVPRCTLHFFINQLVDEMSDALETGNLVDYLKERKDLCDKRDRCRAQHQALDEALPQTDAVIRLLLKIRKNT